jgi:putative transposase
MVLTYRYRIKDATAGRHLLRQARAVNRVWNYCGEIHEAARRYNRHWPSGFDLINLTSGSSKLLGLHSDTVQAVCKQFALSRDAHRKRPRWRGRKSLSWIPFQAARAIRIDRDGVILLGHRYRLWLSRPIEGAIRCGSFAQDARGHWLLNLQLEVPEDREHGTGEIGVDLGLKSLAALSTGEKIEAPRLYRKYERALAIAQRAGHKPRVRAIHAKIANCRMREWICGGCGARHDRDINSAINILISGRNVGLQGTEILSLQGGEDVNSSVRLPRVWKSTPI